jgi:hypothetical protein
MTRYELLLFLHVAAAIVWLGAATVVQFLAVRAERSRESAELHRIASDAEWLAMRLFVPASLAVFVFGLALVFDGPWAFDQLWIVLGLVGYAFSFFVGILFLSPESAGSRSSSRPTVPPTRPSPAASAASSSSRASSSPSSSSSCSTWS